MTLKTMVPTSPTRVTPNETAVATDWLMPPTVTSRYVRKLPKVLATSV